MKRLQRVARWLLIAFGLGVFALCAVHLALRPNPDLAASEQYHVLSAYIVPNLTGESHDLGDRNGLVVIDGRTTFSEPLVNSNKFKQYCNGSHSFLLTFSAYLPPVLSDCFPT